MITQPPPFREIPMRRFTSLLIAAVLVLARPGRAQTADLAPADNLVTKGIPPISAALAQEARRDGAFRPAGRLVARGRPLRLHVYAPRRAGPRSLGDRPRPAAERPHGGPARGRRLGSKRLVAGRQDAAIDGVRLRERELPLARGRRER